MHGTKGERRRLMEATRQNEGRTSERTRRWKERKSRRGWVRRSFRRGVRVGFGEGEGRLHRRREPAYEVTELSPRFTDPRELWRFRRWGARRLARRAVLPLARGHAYLFLVGGCLAHERARRGRRRLRSRGLRRGRVGVVERGLRPRRRASLVSGERGGPREAGGIYYQPERGRRRGLHRKVLTGSRRRSQTPRFTWARRERRGVGGTSRRAGARRARVLGVVRLSAVRTPSDVGSRRRVGLPRRGLRERGVGRWCRSAAYRPGKCDGAVQRARL